MRVDREKLHLEFLFFFWFFDEFDENKIKRRKKNNKGRNKSHGRGGWLHVGK